MWGADALHQTVISYVKSKITTYTHTTNTHCVRQDVTTGWENVLHADVRQQRRQNLLQFFYIQISSLHSTLIDTVSRTAQYIGL